VKISSIEFSDKNFLDDQWNSFVASIKQAISHGAVLVEKFHDSDGIPPLVKLSNSLGYPIPSTGLSSEDGIIFRLEASRELKRDHHENIIYSLTGKPLYCHTDGANENSPYDIVIMHCVKPAKEGGETILFHVDEIVELLDQETVATLQEEAFPFPSGKYSIISFINGCYEIRYNRHYIDSTLKKKQENLSNKYLEALNKLDELVSLEKTDQAIKLRSGECILINNRIMLHGRCPFVEPSDRFLKRVRVNLKKPAV
jgi:alpha-ketoglutarate-dependent taurine dioxygenase